MLDVPAAFPAILDAVAVSAGGDVVRIAPGIYGGTRNCGLSIGINNLSLNGSDPEVTCSLSHESLILPVQNLAEKNPFCMKIV